MNNSMYFSFGKSDDSGHRSGPSTSFISLFTLSFEISRGEIAQIIGITYKPAAQERVPAW